MITLSVDSKNDLYLDSFGNISVSDGIQAIEQQCLQWAKTLLGEMVYNVDQGIPYFQTIWVGVPKLAPFISALRRSFLSVDGVTDVVSLDTDVRDNTLFYNAKISTIYGNLILSDQVTQ